jgi:hypothetical protein
MKVSKKQFELLLSAITNGVYYSAHPDKHDAMQELAAEDIIGLPRKEQDRYMTIRNLGKALFFTYPKGTSVDDIIMEYVDSFFEFIKDEESESI